MQKVVNVFVCIIAIAFIFACGSGPEVTPVNITPEASGDISWSSSYGAGTVKIDKSFKYVGMKDLTNAKARRQYHIWKKSSGEIIYIVDLQVKSSWSFPDDYDPGLGNDQNPNEKGIVAHKPMKYTIWDGINPRSLAVLYSLEVKVPKCRLAIQTGKFSPSRKSGFFLVLVKETECGNNDINPIVNDARQYITIM